jgi:hypothetical protein
MGSDADAVSVVDDRADELSSPQAEPTGSTTTAVAPASHAADGRLLLTSGERHC